jgi:hypothetical protein
MYLFNKSSLHHITIPEFFSQNNNKAHGLWMCMQTCNFKRPTKLKSILDLLIFTSFQLISFFFLLLSTPTISHFDQFPLLLSLGFFIFCHHLYFIFLIMDFLHARMQKKKTNLICIIHFFQKNFHHDDENWVRYCILEDRILPVVNYDLT